MGDWRLFVHRRWLQEARDSGECDLLLVGPGGLFAIDVARAEPESAELSRAYRSYLEDQARRLLERCAAPERSAATLGVSPIALQPVLVVPGRWLDVQLGRARLLGERNLHEVLLTLPRKLDRAGRELIRREWVRALPAFTSVSALDLPADDETAASSMAAEPDGLFEIAEAEAAIRESNMAAPIERWMTFLDPRQSKLVSRTFNGPARITGPAGTGKTVVGLHRAVYLAQRSSKKILFVTYANNLPRVQRTLARQLSPEVVERIEFTSLHKLALSILSARSVEHNLNSGRAETLAALAFRTREQQLRPIVDNPHYWIEEIGYVIKGRMIADLAGYRLTERRGRRMPLRPQDRAVAWEMYEEYERLRRGEGVDDFNDVLALALAEVRREPLDPAYGAVIVDEVQDLTLTGIRLLHAIGGDGPNGLLLIGDGQQAVYPGGYRLSEAGVTVPGGRGIALTTNYRNRAEILQAAMRVVAGYTFDDIDESTLSGDRAVETTLTGGIVTAVQAPTVDDHDRQLAEAVGHAEVADSAVLCRHSYEVERYQRILRKAGIPTTSLEAYDGTRSAACKVGTFTRVKGLDFKHVFIPRQDLAVPAVDIEDASSQERTELARRRLYVAITRARDSVWFGSVRPAPR